MPDTGILVCVLDGVVIFSNDTHGVAKTAGSGQVHAGGQRRGIDWHRSIESLSQNSVVPIAGSIRNAASGFGIIGPIQRRGCQRNERLGF